MSLIHRNIQRIESLPFEDYLKLPGKSHSSLKHPETMQKTEKMVLGSMVDSMLTLGDSDFSHPLYSIARSIANTLAKELGPAKKILKPQLSFTAEIVDEETGLVMPVKGRPDFILGNVAVIDLKLTDSKTPDSLITFMGYDNQLWNYGKLGIVNNHFICIYSKPLKQVFWRKRLTTQLSRDVAENQWLNWVHKFGVICV